MEPEKPISSITENKEMNTAPFPEKSITGQEPAWCVDGRHGQADKGPQMMGGSLAPVMLKAILENQAFNSEFVAANLQTLKDAGFALGFHRDSHAHDNASGCGFADKLAFIVQTAQENHTAIKDIILSTLKQHPDLFPDTEIFSQSIDAVSQSLLGYNHNLDFTGENLISQCENAGANIVVLQGNHEEQAAYINFKSKTTLDVAQANANGQPVFNLDLWALQEQAKVLNIDQMQSAALGLMLYVATEMVLVEKGDSSKRLPIIVYA